MLTLTNGTPLTATEAKMLSLLSDGAPHSRKELHECLWDELSELALIQSHISRLRRKLKGDLTILCEFHKRSLYYRLIKLVGNSRKQALLLNASD